MKSMLFVCLGNICRSPIGEGVMRHLTGIEPHDTSIDSCGVSAYHIGEAPDPRSIAIAAEYHIDISMQRARELTNVDFSRFDVMFCMDHSVLRVVQSMKPEASTTDIVLMRDFDPDSRNADVPDPYYGTLPDFRNVYSIIERSCRQYLNLQ